MTDRVDPGRIENRFHELTYPVTRDDAAAAFRDVTVVAGDEEANLGRVISETGSDAFQEPAVLLAEVRENLPGDPGTGSSSGSDAGDT
jgi:hypothetical protein